jgi:NADPH-dependent 2,4-dienoyl-CoA reductase/sulfur reductase-like enzyme
MVSNLLLGAAITVTIIRLASAAACPACRELSADVVVLGGGAAGSYVAAQLTDVHNKNVIVVDSASRLVQKIHPSDIPLFNIPHGINSLTTRRAAM